MQGFILNTYRCKNEDLIVYVLSKEKLKTLYRFYGARHSNINLGYKIDYEVSYSKNSKIPMLRNIYPLKKPFMTSRSRLYFWKIFIKLLFDHLKGNDILNSFYFNNLEISSNVWNRQNPKRVVIEYYVKMLEIEGRLYKDCKCFICGKRIENNLCLVRGFLTMHIGCIPKRYTTIQKDKIYNLFKSKTTLLLNDEDIEKIWNIILEGL